MTSLTEYLKKNRGLTSLSAIIAALLCSAFISGSALADDDDDDDAGAPAISYPYLKGDLEIELQSDNTFRADEKDEEVSESESEVTLSVGLFFNENFSINSTLVLEPVKEVEGEDSHFENNGIYAEELYGKFSLGRFALFGGKFNVNYGKAWDLAPGIYGTDFAEDGYEITERIGFGATAEKNAGGLGEITVTAAIFKSDISSLSNSFVNNRGQLDVDDGGFGNTDNLENFSFAIDGSKIPALPGVSYHVGYIHQGKGRIGDLEADDFARLDDQNGFVFGLYGEREYNNVKFEFIGEFAYFDNYIIEEEEAVENIYFLTLGGKVGVNKFNVAVSYTYRPYELVDGDEFEDHLATISAGYEVRDDLLLEVGYRYQTNEEQDAHTVGVKLTKEIEFNTAQSKPLK